MDETCRDCEHWELRGLDREGDYGECCDPYKKAARSLILQVSTDDPLCNIYTKGGSKHNCYKGKERQVNHFKRLLDAKTAESAKGLKFNL